MRSKRIILLVILFISLTACDKMGATGILNQNLGNWAELKLPKYCVPKEIASSSDAGVALLCEDGRLFH